MHEEKRNKDRWYTDWDEPFIANVTRRMKYQAFCRKLVIELSNQRLQRFHVQTQIRHQLAQSRILIASCLASCASLTSMPPYFAFQA